MKRARSLVKKAVLATVVVFLLVLTLPALAQEDTGTTTTSSAPAENLVPAVPVEEPPAADAIPDWTYRYLIPTGLVIAGVVVVVTSVKYFTDVVRKRYRIIEE